MLQRQSFVDTVAILELRNWLNKNCSHYAVAFPINIDAFLWRLIRSAAQAGATVTGRVTERIKGGFSINLGGIRGFLPNSHSSGLRFTESQVDESFEFKVLKFTHPRDSDLVVSRSKLAEQRLAELVIGQCVDGRVCAIVEYGAFVDLGGFDGLLHKTKMGKGRGAVPSEILTEGQRIAVLVTDIDRERGRIGLRLLQRSPAGS